ncbi:MAG: hypothetical protein JWP63_7036 [Candidatus Solibacter sp.]|nr:hypothetical protein [Candidatus Solibacter sp.]
MKTSLRIGLLLGVPAILPGGEAVSRELVLGTFQVPIGSRIVHVKVVVNPGETVIYNGQPLYVNDEKGKPKLMLPRFWGAVRMIQYTVLDHRNKPVKKGLRAVESVSLANTAHADNRSGTRELPLVNGRFVDYQAWGVSDGPLNSNDGNHGQCWQDVFLNGVHVARFHYTQFKDRIEMELFRFAKAPMRATSEAAPAGH